MTESQKWSLYFTKLFRVIIYTKHFGYKSMVTYLGCFWLQILYFVYKNIAFGLTLFYYEVYLRFAGDVLYDGWYMLTFNLCLTSLPVIYLGVLEQDVSSDACLEVR